MPATVTIRRWTGASGAPTKTDITGINTRANAEDAHSTAGTSNPIQIPAAGTNYSYWVHTQLSADTSPTGTINNIRWYTDGTNNFGTGVTCTGQSASSYVQATGTAGTTGTQLTTGNHIGLTAAPVDVFTFTSAAPKALTGSISNPTTGDIPNSAFVYQLAIGTTAAPGATGTETFTFKYDET
jgi:hypothetical protein